MINPPNLFLIGAPKAGTSAVANILSKHEDIYCWKKEPRFFDAHTYYKNPSYHPIKDIDEYLSYYDNDIAKVAKYRLDASVFNMYSVKSIHNILRMSPDAKFILIIRDPLSATKSMFNQRLKYIDRSMREVSDDFLDCWKLLDARSRGEGFPENCKAPIVFRYDYLYHYERYIPEILSIVKSSNIKIMTYEDFKNNPEFFIYHLQNWLKIKEAFSESDTKVINPSIIIKNSLWNQVIWQIKNKSIYLRLRLGMTGKRVRFFNKIILKSALNNTKDTLCDYDSIIKDEFIETYDYLSQAKRDGIISVLRE